MLSSNKLNTKSRTGCSACKRKRVKCDEAKPVCTRCQKSRNADACDYSLTLSWTQGRPFKKRKLDVSSSSREDSSAPSQADDGDSLQQSPSGQSASDAASCFENSLHAEISINASGLENSLAVWEAAPVGDGIRPGPQISHNSGSEGRIAATPPSLDSDLHGHVTANHSPSRFEDAPDDDSLEVIISAGASRATADITHPTSAEGEYALLQSPSRTIPPALSTYPLLCPSESPNAYFYLHHYSVHTSATLFPLLPETSRSSLLSVAASNPHLLSALLAIAVDQYGRLRNDSSAEISKRTLFYSRKALTGLQKAVNDPLEATSFPTISTALALCTHDVLMSGNVQGWKTHLRGVEQLLTLAIGESRESSRVTDPSMLLLIKWFAAIDMFAGISSLEKTLVPDGRYWSIGISADGSAQHVDEFVGFSLELVPILSRISRMARIQQRKTTLASTMGPDYIELADDLASLLSDNVQHTEQQLISLLSRVTSLSTLDTSLAEGAKYCHRLFVYAALLHLYRRVQELPKDHPKPEYATSKIIETIGLLRPDAPASILILWPLFSAGCETDDPVRRQIILNRMIDLRRYGMGNVDQAIKAMKDYWQSDTGERWDVFLGRHGIDLVLF